MQLGKTTVKDLKYYSGTDSKFWLPQCIGLRALRLIQGSSFVDLFHGKLTLLDTPPDLCTRLEIQHQAPDRTIFTNVFHLHMVSRLSVAIETCSPQHGSCYPNI